MTEDTEQALIERFLQGDASAFDHLLAPLESQLRSFLRGQLRTRPEIDVEDVLQEVRIYLFQRLDRYNPEYPLIVFARGLAKNVAKRFLFRKSDLAPLRRGGEEDDSEWTEDLSPAEVQMMPLRFRQAVGQGRFEDPDGPPPPSRLFLEIFEIFLRYGGYPHQQAAFGYSVLVWGKAKRKARGSSGDEPESESLLRSFRAGEKVPVTGDPDRVVREVGPRELESACDEMLVEIAHAAHLDEDFLRRVRLPLDLRLQMTAGELFARDKVSMKIFQELVDRVTGGTSLREYFGRDERKSVADWTRGVKERVKKAVLDPASTRRSPLPEVPDSPTPREP